MSTINRFLSRKDKDGSTHRRDKSRDKTRDKSEKFVDKKPKQVSIDIFGLFQVDPQRKQAKNLELKISAIKQRLRARQYSAIDDEAINYAIHSRHADGDVDKAFELLVLFQESVEGIIKPYDPHVQMLGAENRGGVSCYLDSLLFAMFARLRSFEPILYTNFNDEPRRRLSTLIRLWVNTLRTGKLIHTDTTKYLQEALAACGWDEAIELPLKQQDTSEAFNKITDILKLPLLTLKMDIFHTGKEDETDDHKFIQERLLEVAVPDEPTNTERPITLEACLESYFNNQIEVKRKLERSHTLSSFQSSLEEKGESSHVEVLDLSSPNTPISAPGTPLTPNGRLRGASIIRHRVITEDEKDDHGDTVSVGPSIRKGSVRAEVMMPAWQFFNLIPWYTKTSPTTDAEVAAHFSQSRPVLGICLKRYGMSENGQCVRKETFIDIPLDIRLPHFINDQVSEDGSLMGNFKLSLQSIICHQGQSLDSGHYISFIRGTSEISDGDSQSDRRLSNNIHPPHYSANRWIRHNDLADPRVEYVDIEEALKPGGEMPYLLFYQVQPADDYSPEFDKEPEPPAYADSAIAIKSSDSSPKSNSQSSQPRESSCFDNVKEEVIPNIRLSSDVSRSPPLRRSINLPDDNSLGSLTFTDASRASTVSSVVAMSAPSIQDDDTTVQRMSRAAAKFTKSASRSRPNSASGENRLSATFSRLHLMKSKEQLNKYDQSKALASSIDGEAGSRSSISEGNAVKLAEVEKDQPKGKRGRHRDKSKGPSEKSQKLEKEHQRHHSNIDREKLRAKTGRGSLEIPDRECTLM